MSINKNDKINEVNNENTAPKKKNNSKIASVFLSKAFRRGTVATVITCLFIVAIIVINILCGVLTTKTNFLNFDFSTSSVTKLSEDTTDMLASLDKNITITILADEKDYQSAGEVYAQAYTLIKQYDTQCDKIKVEFVDLYSNPTYVNKYPKENLAPANYIVSCGDEYRVLTESMLFNTSTDESGNTVVESINIEQSVTTAIMNVIGGEQTKITFINGFGDYDANAFKNILKQNNYEILETPILTEDFDEESNVAVLFAPTVDLSTENAQEITDYLNNDGKYGRTLMYVPASTLETDTPILNSLLEEWDIKVKQGIVTEQDEKFMVTNSGVSVLTYDDKDFTAGLRNETLPLIQQYASPFELLDENTVKPLFSTSDKAALIPYDVKEDFTLDDAEKGKFTVGAISTKTDNENKSCLIAIGSPYMFMDQFLATTTYNNADYLVNMVNIQSDKPETGIIIAPKNTNSQYLGIKVDQANALLTLFAVVIPIVLLIAGAVVWIRRRNK